MLIMFCALAAGAKKIHSGPSKVTVAAPVEEADTIRTGLEGIVLSGYDKPNQATREAFFVTNRHADSLTVAELNITLTYSDLQGRMLHQATRSIKCHIPAGATRRVEIPSWDRNCSFHYFRSPAPKRRPSTPYRVTSSINYLLPTPQKD